MCTVALCRIQEVLKKIVSKNVLGVYFCKLLVAVDGRKTRNIMFIPVELRTI
jgi:hypothetical protein